ncbi:type IV pilus minor pilin PilW [Sulfuricaulis limicola]|uniref:Type IV pilus minor pilin PilW n=1 Tax=Sulfuricaulis limicola TaxID=1620215 RepID=A0A1B4XEL9_9GAMM|nr:PilW family protein [Sulfuricaulis limicola]BAV33246.1 type IV pilus minor pilin PilW [Sulfuricaulis limicola]
MKSVAHNTEKMRGFSLVELMVALTIGLIILSAVSMLFVGSKKTYTTQDSLARLQENARFAMQFIIKDLRMAGYYGCIDEISPDAINSTLNGSSDFFYNAQIPIEGLNNATGTWYPSGETTLPTNIKAGTDAIAIRKADANSNLYLDQEMPNTSAVLKTNKTDPVTGAAITITDLLSVGEIIMVSDCASADIMQITQLNTTDPHLVHNSGSSPLPGNSTQKLSKSYSPSGNGTRIMKFTTVQYYIATGASGNPALFRKELNKTPVELVDGIENLQILYGKDTDSDRLPNRYLKAGDAGLQSATDWGSVVSARIGILARTLSDKETGKPKETDLDTFNYDVDGDGTNELSNPGDHYKRRVFQAVVHLRNL